MYVYAYTIGHITTIQIVNYHRLSNFSHMSRLYRNKINVIGINNKRLSLLKKARKDVVFPFHWALTLPQLSLVFSESNLLCICSSLSLFFSLPLLLNVKTEWKCMKAISMIKKERWQANKIRSFPLLPFDISYI